MNTSNQVSWAKPEDEGEDENDGGDGDVVEAVRLRDSKKDRPEWKTTRSCETREGESHLRGSFQRFLFSLADDQVLVLPFKYTPRGSSRQK